MSPDDPRHGKTTGYRLGCREACCRRAMADAMANRRKRQYLARTDSLGVPNLGTKRRIQALVALGWSLAEISRRAGYSRSHVGLMLKRRGPLQASTAVRMAAVYDELSMRLPPQETRNQKIDASRARSIARRNGWLPPLVWDDIDTDPAPRLGTTHRPKTDLDPVVVERVLAGDRLPMTRAERVEVVRRALARGWSEAEIEARTGIAKATDKSRYARPGEEAAA